jgi:hypothetical protein
MSEEHARSLREAFENQLATALLRDGVVNRRQLEEARNLQVVMGGHLGTNLWDLDFADCHAVDAVAAGILRLPLAKLSSANNAVVRRVPAQLARKLSILPIAQEGRTLRVASCEPWDVSIAEQIERLTNLRVETVYTGEVALAHAQKELLGIAPPVRIALGPQTCSEDPEDEGSSPAVVPEDLMSDASFQDLYASTSPGEEILPEIEIILEDEIVDLAPIAEIEEAGRLLDAADSREEIGEILARFALSRGERVVLLVRQRAIWTGWTGAGPGVEPHRVRGLIVPSEAGTIFGLVGSTEAPYLGPLHPHRVHLHFAHALGGDQPRTVGLFPVHYRGKLVFGIYLDSGDTGQAPDDIADLLLVAQRAPAALERVVQRRLASDLSRH